MCDLANNLNLLVPIKSAFGDITISESIIKSSLQQLSENYKVNVVAVPKNMTMAGFFAKAGLGNPKSECAVFITLDSDMDNSRWDKLLATLPSDHKFILSERKKNTIVIGIRYWLGHSANSPERFLTAFMHEYGHYLTHHTIDEINLQDSYVRKAITSRIRKNLNAPDEKKATAAQLMTYHHFYIEKIANEKVGLDPYDAVAATTNGYRPPSDWDKYPFAKMLNYEIPKDMYEIIAIGLGEYSGKLSDGDRTKFNKFLKGIYDMISSDKTYGLLYSSFLESTNDTSEYDSILMESMDDDINAEVLKRTGVNLSKNIPRKIKEIEEELPLGEDESDAESTNDGDGNIDDAPPTVKPESMPKQTDAAEIDKNGIKRKELYIAFINYSKRIRLKNTFGSVFDKDAFSVTYPFVPHEMRYFYRLSNPLLCVLDDDLTFFALSELTKINKDNPHRDNKLIFAASSDAMLIFNIADKAIYRINEDDLKAGKSGDKIGNNFDNWLESLIGETIL